MRSGWKEGTIWFNPFVNLKNLLAVAFTLARELHISPADLDKMDFQEVKFYNDELTKYLQEKINKQNRAK